MQLSATASLCFVYMSAILHFAEAVSLHHVAVGAVQMKEQLQGVSSSLVLITDIHLYVLKAEGPQVQDRRSDNAHNSIDKVHTPWQPCEN